MRRRRFIQAGTMATTTFLVPKFLKAFDNKNFAPVPPGNKVIVVLQLSGGNDGLNTVIPIRNDIYYKSRPTLGIQKDAALRLTDEAGLHPELTGFKNLFDDGSLGILNGVGYPNPDRSHFRSMDIWQSASSSDEYITTGWMGRYLDAQCSGCDKPTQALEVDDTLSLALKGEKEKGIACKDPQRLYSSSRDILYQQLLQQHNAHDDEKPVDYLYKTLAETLSSAKYIFDESRLHPSAENYPKTEAGKNFKTIASLILSNINTKIYYVSVGSFDTHVNQQQKQQQLFKEMNDAVSVFVTDMKKNHRFNDVLLLTFSEFGRRVAQNASGGTDHGTANNMFLISGALQQKGLINSLPDLENLDQGDLKYQLDFKNVYATVLNKWLAANDEKILGKKFVHLNFI